VPEQSRQSGIDPAWAYGILRTESAWASDARSGADARGLMQLLPDAAALVAKRNGLDWSGGESLYDPIVNVTLGTRYLAQVARFAGDIDAKLAAIPAENGALVLLCWERQITGPDQCPSAARGGLRARPPRHPDRGDGPGARRLPVTRQ